MDSHEISSVPDTRPVLGGLIDLGPSAGHLGCGSAGTTAVPDRIGPYDLRAACDAHDACSVALTERNHLSIGALAKCQADFAKDIVDSNGTSLFARAGGVVLAVPYAAATSVVGLGHWTASRALDALDAVASGISSVARSIRGNGGPD